MTQAEPSTGQGSGKLLGPLEVRELAERLDVTPTKKLGQNFVIDPNTVRKIVRLAGVEAEPEQHRPHRLLAHPELRQRDGGQRGNHLVGDAELVVIADDRQVGQVYRLPEQ